MGVSLQFSLCVVCCILHVLTCFPLQTLKNGRSGLIRRAEPAQAFFLILRHVHTSNSRYSHSYIYNRQKTHPILYSAADSIVSSIQPTDAASNGNDADVSNGNKQPKKGSIVSKVVDLNNFLKSFL